jgi:hypothetical protein
MLTEIIDEPAQKKSSECRIMTAQLKVRLMPNDDAELGEIAGGMGMRADFVRELIRTELSLKNGPRGVMEKADGKVTPIRIDPATRALLNSMKRDIGGLNGRLVQLARDVREASLGGETHQSVEACLDDVKILQNEFRDWMAGIDR